MRKIILALGLCILLSISSVIALTPKKIYVHRANIFDEYTTPDSEVFAIVNIDNALVDLDDVKITLFIPELSVRRVVGPFDLDEGKEATKKVFVSIPVDAESGYYAARITFSNDYVRKVVHRYVIVE